MKGNGSFCYRKCTIEVQESFLCAVSIYLKYGKLHEEWVHFLLHVVEVKEATKGKGVIRAVCHI